MTVFRFVKNSPPIADDFSRPIDNPNRQPKEEDDPCALCALSVLGDPDEIPVFQDLIPGFKKRAVARGDISAADGVVKNSPIESCEPPITSHHDWWVPLDIDPAPNFEVVGS
jgi:hypothetical protein